MKIIASLAHVYCIANTEVWFQHRQSLFFSVSLSIRITYRSFILESLIVTEGSEGIPSYLYKRGCPLQCHNNASLDRVLRHMNAILIPCFL